MGIVMLLYVTIYVAAPSSPPESLKVSSTSPTSISITWGDVPCRERNVDMITGYSVTYFCDNCSRDSANETVQVFGANNKTFTANQLIPRTKYTFEVRAFHSQFIGPLANVIGVTAVAKGK